MSRKSKSRLLVVPFAILALTASIARAELTIGNKAPGLDIQHWVSDNNGKFPKVQKFDPNKVYVVEFWATWCGPCVASMPHLVEVQKKYSDKNVQIISVSNEDLQTVEEFLTRDLPKSVKTDEKTKTFRDLTSTYCLTTDPDGSVYTDYMEASGEGGIPCAFIVGKDGVIEWIGHPMEMDEPLEQVLEGKWNRELFAKKRVEERERAMAIAKEREAINEGMNVVAEYIEKKTYDKALKKIDELIGLTTEQEMKEDLGRFKIQVLMEADPKTALKPMTDLISKSDNPSTLVTLAWQVVEMSMNDKSSVTKELLQAGITAAEKAAKIVPKEAVVYDTLARLTHISGDLDKALEIQKKAVMLSPGTKDLKDFLAKLEAEKAAKK
jgi:thiol-disulfide isomerase/thioredoxin